jgi:hypothetical protein
MKRLLLVVVGLVSLHSQAWSLAQTSTGFYYPTGTSSLGSYAGWLAVPPEYDPNYYHLGKDIAASYGGSVYAIADGTVYYVSKNGWSIVCTKTLTTKCCSNTSTYCNVGLVIQHTLSDGTKFLAFYGHVRTTFTKDDEVQAGGQIATIGHWYGGEDHLHFGIHPEISLPEYFGRAPLSDPPQNPLPTYGFVDPINYITIHAPQGSSSPRVVYSSSSYSSQNPPVGLFNAVRGSVRPYTLWFQNTGTDTWTQGAGSSQVTLVSCDAEFVLKLSTEPILTPPRTVLT